MKKILLYTSALLLSAGLFFGCSDDDKGNGMPGNNKFTIGSTTYDFANGYMEHYGYEEEGNSVCVDLYIGTTGNEFLYFEMFVPNGNTRLIAGTYTFKDTYAASTYCYGAAVYGSGEDDHYDVTGGTVVVQVSGSTYTITVNCTLEGGGTTKGVYIGELGWYNEIDGEGTGEFSFNGNDYDFTRADVHYYGEYYSGNATANTVNVFLSLGGENAGMFFDMNVSNAYNNLVAGTYGFNDNYAAFTIITDGDSYAVDSEDGYDIVDGTVVVQKSVDIYTITINCELEDGSTLTGEYTGTLGWEDYSTPPPAPINRKAAMREMPKEVKKTIKYKH